VVEALGAPIGEVVHGNVALVGPPKSGARPYDRTRVVIGCAVIGIDAHELARLAPLLDEITEAVRAAQGSAPF